MTRTEQIKSALRGRPPVVKNTLGLSTGSTMVNLACSGNPDYGFLTGHYYLFVGDSNSGKTFLSLTCLAEATINSLFNEYRLIYDGTEGGAMMDIGRFFGHRLLERIEPPATVDGEPHYSSTVQEFYFNVDDALKRGKPFIYILDSQDCLSSDQEVAKFDEGKKAFRKGKTDTPGSYGDAKAKVHSASLRRLMGPLSETNSILLVVNQTRDSFDLFEKSTYSGGRALKFYATLQLWSSSAGKLKRTVRGKERQLGITAKVRVVKNRVTGRDRTVLVPIYHSVGIDDIGSCVDYLVSEGHWKKDGQTLKVSGLGPEATVKYDRVVQWVEEEQLEDDLRQLVAQVWNDVEEACRVERKSRYA